MLDGKTAQSITETPAASSCFICGVTTSNMNKLSDIKNRPINEEAIKFGMSPLHAGIKFMECILHMAYNLSFKRWRIATNTHLIKDAQKAFVQKEFREKIGIKVDVVKQDTRSTNDGNTSRRFFANQALTSEITGISEKLIRRFAVILEVITCTEIVDSTKFGKYAGETAEMYIAKYRCYNIPSTVHKVLVHGKQIIESCTFPVGSLSEEVQECRNKDYKRYRCLHSRKCNRIATNEDVLHMILLSSDPIITCLRPKPKKKIIPISEETKEMITLSNSEKIT
ncbi:hypothetical protein KPH14_002674 [Odynerus spinipes]|uniref:Uncharacterized protein n=1 Tax=Odynerus spinipes TaxID=1348599 RepID=A0AAD9REI1_9HYME|nr:hypothetical protein KPH14_002674 [Odynerus spinipes]